MGSDHALSNLSGYNNLEDQAFVQLSMQLSLMGFNTARLYTSHTETYQEVTTNAAADYNYARNACSE